MSIRLICMGARPMATTRLLCIPFAGGGALAFRGWEAHLPAHVEVFALQLPAREDRRREAAMQTWEPMMDALAKAVTPLPYLPTAIFGHSLGAVIGLELCRWMQRRQPGQLKHFFPSGRAWPGCTDARTNVLHSLPDNQFLHELDRQYGSLSTSLAHPDIRDLVLPTLRADLALLDSFQYESSAELDCPVTAFFGTRDPATPTGSVAPWARETRGRFQQRALDGEHFFLESRRAELLADIASCLAAP